MGKIYIPVFWYLKYHRERKSIVTQFIHFTDTEILLLVPVFQKNMDRVSPHIFL